MKLIDQELRQEKGGRRIALILLPTFSCLLLNFCSTLHASEAKPDAFLTRYCARCHGVDEQKGDRRFDDLPMKVGTDVAIAERWQEILHQLQLGEMPPSDEAQPTDDERRAMIAWIESQVTHAQTIAQDRGGQVVHRRLSRAEYLNTI